VEQCGGGAICTFLRTAVGGHDRLSEEMGEATNALVFGLISCATANECTLAPAYDGRLTGRLQFGVTRGSSQNDASSARWTFRGSTRQRMTRWRSMR